MKIAILSDIHGNMVALESVLKNLEQQGNIDHIIVTGDMFAFGSAPNDVLATFRQLPKACFLLGNTDRYLLEGKYPSVPDGDGWQDKLLLSFHWTVERLGLEGLRFLKALPPYQAIQAGTRQLLAVHGSPQSDEEGLTIKTTANDLREMPIGPQVVSLVCGHTHIPIDRNINGVRMVNAGSVGLPFDGDPRACYAIVSGMGTNGDGHARVELKRVAYDVEQEIAQLYAANHPIADVGAYNLRTGRPMGSSLIYSPEMRHHHVLIRKAVDSLQPFVERSNDRMIASPAQGVQR